MTARVFFLQSESTLLDRMGQGDEDALLVLYRANWKPIQSFVLRNSGTDDDAKDMLQEALIVLWEKVRSGKFEQNARASTFIYATVRNIWFRQLARRRRELRLDGAAENSRTGDPSPLEELIDSEETTAVLKALDALGEPCRQLLLLFYWEELQMDQIARQMGFANADTVKSKKYQCKKALEQRLRAQGG